MNNKTLLIVCGIIIIGAAAWVLSNQQASKSNEATMSGNEMSNVQEEGMTGNIETEPQGANMEGVSSESGVNMDEQKKMTDSERMTVQPGAYKDYSAETVKAEQNAGQKVVLFFHAPWCPFCREADTAFQSKLDQIPDGVTVLKTDYDSNRELKKQYGVTYQHTFVQIDSQGNQVTKWSGGDIDTLTANLK